MANEPKTNERIMDVIRKVLALSESPNENEAAAAAAKAQELMQKYNLEMSDLVTREHDDIVELPIDFFGLKVKQQWLIDLAGVIADAMFCDVLIAGGRKPVMWFVGRKENVEAAEYMYNNLGYQMGWMAYHRTGKYTEEFKEKYGYSPVQAGGKWHPKAWRTSWLLGAVYRIGETLRAQKTNFVESDNSNRAIVLSRDSEIAEYLEEKYPKLGKRNRSQSNINTQGWHAGNEEGKDIAVQPRLD